MPEFEDARSAVAASKDGEPVARELRALLEGAYCSVLSVPPDLVALKRGLQQLLAFLGRTNANYWAADSLGQIRGEINVSRRGCVDANGCDIHSRRSYHLKIDCASCICRLTFEHFHDSNRARRSHLHAATIQANFTHLRFGIVRTRA